MQRVRRDLPQPTWRSGAAFVSLAIGSGVLAVWVSASTAGTVWAHLEKRQHLGCYLGKVGEGSGDWICGDGMSKVLPSFAATAALAIGLFLLGVVVLVFVRRLRHYRRAGIERPSDKTAVLMVSIIAVIAAVAVVFAVIALSGPTPLVNLVA